MTSNAEGLNYFPFLTQQQSPPSSSRTMPNPYGGGSIAGGQTTRRSLPKNLHGNYEGDFSMFTSRSHQATGSLVDQIREAGLDLRLDQHFEAPATEEPLDGDADEVVDEEIRAKIAEVGQPKLAPKLPLPPSPSPLRPSLWQCYKGRVFSAAQCNKIDVALGAMQQNLLLRRAFNGCKLAVLMVSCVVRLLLFNVVARAVNAGWRASRCRNMLRKGSRRLLWCMTLAKCGDVRLFGLVMLLTPLVFVIAALGFLLALYCVIKHGIQSFIRHVRYIDFEEPQIED